ncbi:MAG: tRNA (adenosine(37)-N6)-dimethylallyltransferase MiaA, partial [Fulvivirga sp.]|nr:tRNA (adenosine(37)-N6)-dimethylallyltransferase MiaA [Fulvivirga sp.]
AKPTKDELGQVKHHFIDSNSIQEDISAGKYEKMALEKLKELFQQYDHLILTGGSGLYINAVTEGLAEIPKTDPGLRNTLNKKLKNEGIETLRQELLLLDPVYYNQVDLQNPQRIIRALEVCLSTGKPFSSFRRKKHKPRFFKTIKIGLNRPRQALYARINERMEKMIEQGLFEEAQKLYSYKDHNALQTVGYKEIFDYMDGKYDRKEAVRLLKRNTRRYAKRQLTWFGKDEEISWFEPDEIERIIKFIEKAT